MSEQETKFCKHPERLKGKPFNCSPEQIEKCHGKKKEHSCESENKNKKTSKE